MAVKNLFKHINGLPNIPDENNFELKFDENKLYLNLIKLEIFKNPILSSFEIELSNIIEIDFITEEYMKDKSVIKRAIIGSFINPMATIIGGMSGIGQKKAKKKVYSITYLSSNDEIKNVIFESKTGFGDLAVKFNKEINKKLELVTKNPKIKEIIYSGFNLTENEDGSSTIKL